MPTITFGLDCNEGISRALKDLTQAFKKHKGFILVNNDSGMDN